MTAHTLDEATRLVHEGGGVFAGHSHDGYWNMAGPFGGMTAAVLMRAVLDHPERRGDPAAITVNFCAAIVRGPFRIEARPLRTGKTTQHWFVTLVQGEGIVAASATAVTAIRRETWSHCPAAAPSMQAFDSIAPAPVDGRPPWVARYDMRFTEGSVNIDLARRRHATPQSARTKLWVKDSPSRDLDFVSLTSLSDVFIVRIAQVRGDIPPVATVSMTTYFHVTAAELASHGDGALIGVADAHIFTSGFFDQTSELWSSDGRLLATSAQIVWFKD